MTETPGYRRLGRNGSALFPRSVSSFVFLIVVVIFLFIFYLYMSASSELHSLRTDYEELNTRQLKLKNELLDANVKMERVGNGETECKGAKSELENKSKVCQKELKEKSTLLADLEANKAVCEGTVEQLKKDLGAARQELEAEGTKLANESATAANLRHEIEQLRVELDACKTNSPTGGTNISLTTTQPQTTVVETVVANRDEAAATTTTLDSEKKKKKNKADTAHEQVDPVDKAESDNFAGPRRSPGGRVHLEEVAAQQEKLANNKDLLKMAAKLDKQVEEKEESDRGEDGAVGGGDGEGEEDQKKANGDKYEEEAGEEKAATIDGVNIEPVGERDDQIEFKEA